MLNRDFPPLKARSVAKRIVALSRVHQRQSRNSDDVPTIIGSVPCPPTCGMTGEIMAPYNNDSITNKKEVSMPSKPKRSRSTEAEATSTQAEAGEVSVGNSTRDEDIRRRAYEIYLERGEQ